MCEPVYFVLFYDLVVVNREKEETKDNEKEKMHLTTIPSLLIIAKVTTITSKCVIVHFRFHWILSEFGHFYHAETGQPLSEQGPVVTGSESIH
jgi:hypothetical protein